MIDLSLPKNLTLRISRKVLGNRLFILELFSPIWVGTLEPPDRQAKPNAFCHH